MQIALLGAKGIPCQDGGVEKHVEELAVRLAQKGHQVTVYARARYTRTQRKSYRGVRLVYTPYLASKNLAAITHTLFSIFHLLFQKVDIIHIHSVGPSLLAWIPRILKWNARTIVTFHSRDRYNQKWGRVARFFLALGEWTALNIPHATITVSQNLQKFCQKRYPGKAVVYIPNGAVPNRVRKPKHLSRWGLKENSYILSVSRLIPLKGIHYLVGAYRQAGLSKKLVIVGASPDEDQTYEKYLHYTAGQNPQIVFTGLQKGQILQELFSNAYLYVLPSEVEGLSISLLEAMAAGRCPLVSDIPENRETVGEVGYTFAVKNVNDLVTKLKFLNDHPELVLRAGRLARARVIQFYHWDRITSQVLRLYQTLIDEKKPKMQSVVSAIAPKTLK